MSARTIQILITIGALIIASIRIIWPNLKIDAIILSLFIVAILPWLAPLFKSLELPGGWKFEFQDLINVEKRAGEVGLLAESDEAPEYSFQVIADHDPNLALAGLRIEIENRLVKIANSVNIDTKRSSVGRLMNILAKENLISSQERSVLADIVGILNSAVHGAKVDDRSADWAMEVGPKLLKALDNKIIS